MDDDLAAPAAVVDAAVFSRVDKEKLVALFQNWQSIDDDDGELSAPAAASYEASVKAVSQELKALADANQVLQSELRDRRIHCSRKVQVSVCIQQQTSEV